jgi:hypothetical protein
MRPKRKRLDLVPVAAGLLIGLASASLAADPGDSTPAIQYITDYNVPESPALVAIGASTEQVLHGSTAKPATAQLVNAFQTGDKIASGLALDFSPYFTFHGKVESVQEYLRSRARRWLANTAVSFATMQDPTGRDSLLFGVGLRLTLFDSHDVLGDSVLAGQISRALAAAAEAGEPAEDDEITQGPPVAAVAEVHEGIVRALRRRTGDAMSVGWAAKSEVRHSVASADSFATFRHRAWLAYEHYMSGGRGLRVAVQWRESDARRSSWKAGVALATAGERYAMAIELYLDTLAEDPDHRNYGLAGDGQYRLTNGMSLVASMSTDPVTEAGRTVSKIRLKTGLRWSYVG